MRIPAISFEMIAYTDVGLHRTLNEDFFAVCSDLQSNVWEIGKHELEENNMGSLMIVADGVGGANAGEVAAQLAVFSIISDFKNLDELPENELGIRSFLKKIIANASQKIVEYTQEKNALAPMGTTMVLAWVLGKKSYIVWSGDSRAYLYRKGQKFAPITDDHSKVWNMVKKGEITPEQARLHPDNHIITQCLGDANYPPEPDIVGIEIKEGDRLLLCTDGLNSMMSDAEIEQIINQPISPLTCAKGLIEAAKLAGGHDNITLTLMDIYVYSDKPKVESIVKHDNKSDSKDKALTAILLVGLLLILVMSLVMNSYYENVAEKSSRDSTQIQKPQEQINTETEKPNETEKQTETQEQTQPDIEKPVQQLTNQPVSKKEWEGLKKNYQTMLDKKDAIRKRIQALKDKTKQTELNQTYGKLWNTLKDIVDKDSRLLEPANQTELQKIQTAITTCQNIITDLEKNLAKK